MTPQEVQQAQTIAQIKEWRSGDLQRYSNGSISASVGFAAFNHLDRLLPIVDSQAQKITSLEAMAEINRSALETAKSLIESKTAEIAEARKLAEKMRDASERPGGGHTVLPWERKP